MKWAAALLFSLLILSFFICYTQSTSQIEMNSTPISKDRFSFEIRPYDYGMVDSSGEERGYLTAWSSENSADGTLEIIMLGRKPLADVYVVDDYPSDENRHQLVGGIKRVLGDYGVQIHDVNAASIIGMSDSIIIIPSDAMPTSISLHLGKIASSNAVIFFGKPLSISLSDSGAQQIMGNTTYFSLNLTADDNGIIEGENVRQYGNARVADFTNGWLVVYDQNSTANEIANLILKQGWQENSDDIFDTLNGTKTYFTSKVPFGNYTMRVLVSAYGNNDSLLETFDFTPKEELNGSLSIGENITGDSTTPYSFALRGNLTYPTTYDMTLGFIKDSVNVANYTSLTLVMQTVALEDGAFNANLSSGNYIVRLIDQFGQVRAQAYTHVPDLAVRLVEIEGARYLFNVTLDDSPDALKRAELTIDSNSSTELDTDEMGQGEVPLSLGPGIHRFDLSVDGQTASTYYIAPQEGPPWLFLIFILGGMLFATTFLIKKNSYRKYRIRNYPKDSGGSKHLKVPIEVFMELFFLTQEGRAPGLPLTITDLRLGIQKHATFKGAPVFITDANIFRILEKLVSEGRMLSYRGYFIPGGIEQGKLERLVLLRMISDRLIQLGVSSKGDYEADFIIGRRPVYIWNGQQPSKLCGTGCILIFKDAKEKVGYLRLSDSYDYMRLSLELRYGEMLLMTVGEFLETYHAD